MTESPRWKVLLLENIHSTAREILEREGFEIESLPHALKEDALAERLKSGVHFLGIRSKTQVPQEVLETAKDLISIGCFCIGTNQVDVDAAHARGIPVFNAPFSNTRSVAEMVIAEIVFLARQLGDRVQEIHQGKWNKVSNQCYEVRGKTVGIVGYGHIGTQVGVLAELMGLEVVYYDIIPKLPMGNNQPCSSLEELLKVSDFVTFHVPATPQTHNMCGASEMALMPQGAYLLNASRGSVVDIDALAAALKSGHLAGAAIDVFPEEPEANGAGFVTPLQGLKNVILTPHIGGSTEEAQASIGREVATSLVHYLKHGATTHAVNFPQVDAPPVPRALRILNVHRNVPGVLKQINQIISDQNANILSQVLTTDAQLGYLVMDLEKDVDSAVVDAIAKLPTSIRTRALHDQKRTPPKTAH